MRRSRAGCIDCRKAKVKCDELKPSCGTCARRGKQCHGYPPQQHQKPLKWASTNISVDGPPFKKRRSASLTSLSTEHISSQNLRNVIMTPSERDSGHAITTSSFAEELDRDKFAQNKYLDPREACDKDMDHGSEDVTIRRHSSGGELMACMKSQGSVSPQLSSNVCRSLSPFFSPDIKPEISQGISTYFARHPTELVIGSESFFIHEMNTHVLNVLYSDVEAVGDGLSSIGQIYLHSQGSTSSLALALSSRAKTLERIRKCGEGVRELRIEQIMSMILALVSMELIDTTYEPTSSSLYALHSAAAAIINHFQSGGSNLSSTAKYFIRALAREDILMSLVHRRRLFIPTSAWLDEDCIMSADRFMGFTMTLAPLLEELCALAEDMKGLDASEYPEFVDLGLDTANTNVIRARYESRVNDLHLRISAWQVPLIPTFSGPSSRKFFLHASMYRSAALLYLHRILYPHDFSRAHNSQALALAYDIFAHLSTNPRDNRLALFPIFLAACEFEKEEDRKMALNTFEQVGKSRGTHSTWLTGKFVKDRIWTARDNGEEWGFMRLVERWPGECVPI